MKRPIWLLSLAALTATQLMMRPPSAVAYELPEEVQEGLSFEATQLQAESAKADLKVGGRYFVNASTLNVRSGPDTGSAKVGELTTNDEVDVIGLGNSDSPMVEIRVVRSSKNLNVSLSTKLYVSGDFLTTERAHTPVAAGQLSKYFVVQNVASERYRIYERCTTSPDCAHRLVMETEMVVGRTEGPKDESDRFLTWLGHYRITRWVKFYEDGQRKFPSWYHPNYPQVPPAGANATAWLNDKYLPNAGSGGVYRGAFGWYAAMVAPNANSQWMHGTYGWGADEDSFIKHTRGFWANAFGNPRSSGCIRVENRAIAYSRHILAPGTDIFRVYAIEGYRDPARSAYANQAKSSPWEFILTREGYQKDGPSSDKNSVLARQVDRSQWLESGSYTVDMYPDAIPLKAKASSGEARTGKSGNSYRIPDANFRGIFLVDEGRFVNYQHPTGMFIGGYPNRELPSHLKTSGDYTDARNVKAKGNSNKNNNPKPERPDRRNRR